MTFKERYSERLEENYGGFGNERRNDFLKGTAAGAGGLAIAHTVGNSKLGEGNLDSAKKYWQDNDVWNDTIEKGKSGLDFFKTDNTDATEAVSDKVESLINNV